MGNEPTGGPLRGVRVVEFNGLGPVPHCGMLLSDLGAEVLRIERRDGNGWPNPIVDRGRHVLELDVRAETGKEQAHRAIAAADVLIEWFRPGVMERLSFGPDLLIARHTRLIYGRMTGWGQDGPLARAAGHDINYIALTDALAAIAGNDGHPIPPLNLVGDFGGGSLFLALGIVCALFEGRESGLGQVIDTAIVDGVALLMATLAGLGASGAVSLNPKRNLLGGQSPFYRCYECADGRHIAVGPIEAQFYAELVERIGAPDALRRQELDPGRWGEASGGFEALFKLRSRDEWCALLEGTDACAAPVLNYQEWIEHPHLVARQTYVDVDGLAQAAPAPRFSRTAGQIQRTGSGADLLERWSAAPRE